VEEPAGLAGSIGRAIVPMKSAGHGWRAGKSRNELSVSEKTGELVTAVMQT
jgi:hypothetical protein